MTTDELVADLTGRIDQGVRYLAELRDDDMHPDYERGRLNGKIEGLQVVKDWLRVYCTPENVKCQTCGGTGSLGGNFGPTAWQRCPDCTPENVECSTCDDAGVVPQNHPIAALCPDCTPEHVEGPEGQG